MALVTEGEKMGVLLLPMIPPAVDNGDCIIGLPDMEEPGVSNPPADGVVGVWD